MATGNAATERAQNDGGWPRHSRLAGITLVDIGCGFADLYGFLLQRNADVSYTGIDIVPEFLEVCRRTYPAARFLQLDILLDEIEDRWDWVFLSGAFNTKLSTGDTGKYVRAMLRKMFDLSDRGVAADFLSTYVDFQKEHSFHADPREILDFMKHLTRRVTIRHDYMPYEFCIYAYKDDRIGLTNVFVRFDHCDS